METSEASGIDDLDEFSQPNNYYQSPSNIGKLIRERKVDFADENIIKEYKDKCLPQLQQVRHNGFMGRALTKRQNHVSPQPQRGMSDSEIMVRPRPKFVTKRFMPVSNYFVNGI